MTNVTTKRISVMRGKTYQATRLRVECFAVIEFLIDRSSKGAPTSIIPNKAKKQDDRINVTAAVMS